jgi:hypothetical protein
VDEDHGESREDLHGKVIDEFVSCLFTCSLRSFDVVLRCLIFFMREMSILHFHG